MNINNLQSSDNQSYQPIKKGLNINNLSQSPNGYTLDQHSSNLASGSQKKLDNYKSQVNSQLEQSKDVSSGFLKNAIKGARDVATGVQNFGKGILSAVGIDTSKLGEPSLDSTKPEGQAVDKYLAPKDKAEKVGGYLETGAELAVGGKGLLKPGAKLWERLLTGKNLTDEEKSFKAIVDTVSPNLTKKQTAEALASGRGEGGSLLTKTKIKPDIRTLEVADATKGIIKPGSTSVENIGNVRGALKTEAESLRGQIKSVDHPVSFKEVNAKLNNLEVPISVKSDATLSRQLRLVKDATMKIIRSGKGNVEGLLDARQEFDNLIDKEFPTLYDRENAPMRSAVKAMRDGLNNIIESNLPDDVSYKASLKKQSLFYDAIDNMAEKGVNEVGKTGLETTLDKYPIAKKAVDAAAIGAAGAVGAGGIYEAGKDALGK